MRETPGIAQRVLIALDDIKVLFMMPDASNISLILGIAEEHLTEAIGRLHKRFLETAEQMDDRSDCPEPIVMLEGMSSLLSVP